jgi:hypothetical protein
VGRTPVIAGGHHGTAVGETRGGAEGRGRPDMWGPPGSGRRRGEREAGRR